MCDRHCYFNGLDAATGAYLTPPLRPAELASHIKGESPPERLLMDDLRNRAAARTDQDKTLGPKHGIDPRQLAQTGWGVVFPAAWDATRVAELKEKLQPLLDLRRAPAGRLYRVFAGPDGYRAGEDKRTFLRRFGVLPGAVDPNRGVPYYLLLVGSPEEIPYRFQYQLDVQFAVGRVHFDAPDDYAAYAQGVFEAEAGEVRRPRRVEFFGVANEDDRATQLSANELVKPLAATIAADGWQTRAWLQEEATKARLSCLLGGAETPALLFTASHGLGLRNGDPEQWSRQGALVCQDWPGPIRARGQALPPEFFFAAADAAQAQNLAGLVSFHFACYGAGTPALDDFAHRAFGSPQAIAPQAFVAALPRAMLRGGALAVIGHVERAWGYSFRWGPNSQLSDFESTLKCLLDGYPVGYALEFFNQRYAELATDMTEMLESAKFGRRVDDIELAEMWTAHNDARGYALVGDPAVRLAV